MTTSLLNEHSDHAAAQQGAEPLKSLWISANAGSGKTTALTARVLKLLLLGVIPERICCITYTKAAAGEMRSRIIGQLRGLLLADDAACRTKVEKLLGAAPAPEQMQRARLLFGQVLDSPYGGIQLTTIHGFCQQLLRSFPLEAGIAPHFSVADDTESALIAARVKHRLLDSETMDPALEEAIGLIAERSTESRFNALAQAILNDRGRWEQIWHLQTKETMRERIFALHGLEADVLEEALGKSYCGHLGESQERIIRAALASLEAGGATEKKVGERYARWMESADKLPLIHALIDVWYGKDGALRAKPLTKAILQNSTLHDALMISRDATIRHVEQCAALACAQESYALAILAESLLDLYEQAKHERGALDYDDLIEKVRRLLLGDMAAWVMLKLDHRIDHLLIDEAQDTSAGQWHIAQELARELMSDQDALRSLLVVGDEKQSIYSFQGAAPELYAQMRPEFEALLRHGPAPLEQKHLSTSYRSAPAILHLVDSAAQHALVKPSLSQSGELMQHGLARKDAAGRVVLHPPVAAEEKMIRPPLTIPTEYQLSQNVAQLLAEQVAEQVSGWVKQGRFTPGEILILVRKREPIVRPLLCALQREGLPVAGLDRLVLAEHLAVKDLLALMRWCGNASDDLALAQVLRSPLIGIGDDALRAMAFGRRGSLWEQVTDAMRAQLLRWRELCPATAHEFLTCVLEEDDARKSFAARFGEEVHEILDELKTQAATMPPHMAPTVANFCQLVATSERDIKRELEHGGDNIRVMTVYGAKGLEAKAVLLVDTVSVPGTGKESIFTVRDEAGQLLPLVAFSETAKGAAVLGQAKVRRQDALLAEYYRLLYVALTRARDELHIFAMQPTRGNIAAESWYEILRQTMRQMEGVKEEGDLLLLEDAPAIRITEAKTKVSASPLPGWATETSTVPERVARLSPSKLAEEAILPFSKNITKGAKERGVRIHRMLQFMGSDTDKATLQRLVTHLAPDWEEVERERTASEIGKLLEQERWLFEGGEAELGIAGELMINGLKYPFSGQMDRLAKKGATLVVVDYKTARDIPASADQVAPTYLYQLKTYMALLAQRYPNTPIECAIVWTSGPSLMWLTEQANRLPWDRALTSAA